MSGSSSELEIPRSESTIVRPLRSISRQSLQIAVAFLGFSLIGINDGVIGVVIPDLIHDYNLDQTTVGWLFLMRTVGYFTFAIFGGVTLERIGLNLFLTIGSLMFLLGSGILSLMLPLWSILLGFVLLGCGGVIFETGLNFYIANLPRNTMLLNYLHSCYGIGALLGPAIATVLLTLHFSWNNTYIVLVGISTVLVVGFRLIFPRKNTLIQETEPVIKSNLLIETIKLKVVWIGALFLLFYVGTELSIGNWCFSFLTEERGETVLRSGWLVSGYWFGLTLGRIILGKLSEWLTEQRLVQLCLAGLILGMMLVWLTPNVIVTAIGLWLAGVGLGPIYPTMIALMSHLVPTRILPSAIGVIASGDSIGAALLPWLAGYLAKYFGLGSLIPYIAVLSIGLLFLWQCLSHNEKSTKS
jgi:fucose permease